MPKSVKVLIHVCDLWTPNITVSEQKLILARIRTLEPCPHIKNSSGCCHMNNRDSFHLKMRPNLLSTFMWLLNSPCLLKFIDTNSRFSHVFHSLPLLYPISQPQILSFILAHQLKRVNLYRMLDFSKPWKGSRSEWRGPWQIYWSEFYTFQALKSEMQLEPLTWNLSQLFWRNLGPLRI